MRRLTPSDLLARPADGAGLAAWTRPAALIAAAACWGAGTVVSKQAVAELPPITLLGFQLAVSVAFLSAIAVPTRARSRVEPDGRWLGRLGLLNPGLAYALSLVGLTQISASLSVLLWALEPILILVLAAVVLGERLGFGLVVATAIALAGLVLAVFDPAASGALPGVLLTIAGVAVCAVYTVAARRWLPGSTDSTLGVVLAQQAHALGLIALVLVGFAVSGQVVVPAHVTVGGLASAALSGLLYYTLAYLCYLFALRTIPASVAAASFYLVPVFGITLASFAGERLQALQWLGAALVVGAVVAVSLRPAAATGRPAA